MISEQSVTLFKRMVNEIPAYSKFLSQHKFDPNSVTKIADFVNIPRMSKKHYLQVSERSDLLWPSSLHAPLWFCATSGSTGEPYYFPRNDTLAARGAEFAEAFLTYGSYGKGRTLVLMAFGMGVWIGGIITLRSFEIAAERMQAPVSFLPVGYNKNQIFKALQQLSPEFDQTILVGYPPFVKEIIDEAAVHDIDLSTLHMRLMFAAEAFSETFRDYVAEKAHVQNVLLDTLNIYGSADLGAMAYETPLSILVRQLALQDPLIFRDIFGQIEKTPTLAQYHPEFVEFETVDGELLISSDGALPLLRYAIGDHGGVHSYAELTEILQRHKINLPAEIKRAGIAATVHERPFVFVYERTDLAASLQGIIIYPEFIKEGLLTPELSQYFTERFTMITQTNASHDQYLQINLELRPDVKPTQKLETLALIAVHTSLVEKSSEFAFVAKARASMQLLQIKLWPNADPTYFAPGTKQAWVKKP